VTSQSRTDAGTSGEPAADRPGRTRGVAAVVRANWLFAVVLSLGVTLRALAWAAYQPALFYSDSANYLANTFRVPNTGWHPIGYPLFLDPLLIGHHLAVVTAVQHLMVVGDAVLVYVLLLRLRCGRAVATLACAPLLLDAYQVQIEQYILSEALFETLLTAAVVIALWRARCEPPRVGAMRAAAVAGVLGLCVLVRLDALGFVIPLVGWLAWVCRRQGLSRSWRPVIAAAVVFVLPVAALVGLREGRGGGASVTSMTPIWSYARVAPFANCALDNVPEREQLLCPTEPLGHRPGTIWFQNSPYAPEWQYLRLHPRDTAAIEDFARRVVIHQPVGYLRAVAADFAQQFRPTRAQTPGGPEVRSWQFRLTLTPVDPTKPVPQAMVDEYGTGRARLDVGLARVLRDYQRFGYLPGPVVALLLVFSGVALVARRRHALAPGLFLVLSSAIVTVGFATATVLFSWRYVLPTLLLYPLAGALGWVMVRSPRGSAPISRWVPRARGRADQGQTPASVTVLRG
jgi:hypothetical protein